VISTAGGQQFKFRTPGSWSDIFFGSDFGNGGDNATFTTTASPQTVPIVLDLPNGRWFAVSAAPPPVTNTVVLSVDMTLQVAMGLFDPNSDTVECRGSFNGWGSTFVLTNNPAAVNTNLYVGVVTLVNSPRTSYEYKFWDSNGNAGNSGWEAPTSTGGGNRTFSLLATNGTLTLPPVPFNDLSSVTDFLTEDTLVTFTLNMTNAITTATNYFDPQANNVYVNGDWVPWWAWGDPTGVSYAPYQLINAFPSLLYTNTFLIPKGHSLSLTYKFSVDGADNELPAYVNHIRYIRNFGNYTLPVDKFGTPVTEPPLGNVTIGQPSGGQIPVSWVGLPSAYLQTATSILGPWVTHPETAAYGTPSGIYSTNYPMSGKGIFFRAVK
jgi:hypothetical protein